MLWNMFIMGAAAGSALTVIVFTAVQLVRWHLDDRKRRKQGWR